MTVHISMTFVRNRIYSGKIYYDVDCTGSGSTGEFPATFREMILPLRALMATSARQIEAITLITWRHKPKTADFDVWHYHIGLCTPNTRANAFLFTSQGSVCFCFRPHRVEWIWCSSVRSVEYIFVAQFIFVISIKLIQTIS